ncbi:class I SAM-dependent methyltransferase [Thermostilla marina]
MCEEMETGSRPQDEWDLIYREETPPWETGRPATELVRVLDEGIIPPGTAIELGCGTGADAIYIASKGFELTAIDFSPTAIERARTRAEQYDVNIRFVLDDVYEFCKRCEPVDFVYDAGFYHHARQHDLKKFLDLLWRITKPGSYYLSLAGATGEEASGGPPQVSEKEIRFELGRLFEFVHLRHFRFESPFRREGFLGWSILMRRPEPMSL